MPIAIEWDSNVPAPDATTVTIVHGDTVAALRMQSGRTDRRRFGDGAPDTMTGTLSLTQAQYTLFQTFFVTTTSVGRDWWTAAWLSFLGYSSHAGRFIGYPKRRRQGAFYTQIDVTVLIQRQDYISEAWAQ